VRAGRALAKASAALASLRVDPLPFR
jgi:hypothetical protein